MAGIGKTGKLSQTSCISLLILFTTEIVIHFIPPLQIHFNATMKTRMPARSTPKMAPTA